MALYDEQGREYTESRGTGRASSSVYRNYTGRTRSAEQRAIEDAARYNAEMAKKKEQERLSAEAIRARNERHFGSDTSKYYTNVKDLDAIDRTMGDITVGRTMAEQDFGEGKLGRVDATRSGEVAGLIDQRRAYTDPNAQIYRSQKDQYNRNTGRNRALAMRTLLGSQAQGGAVGGTASSQKQQLLRNLGRDRMAGDQDFLIKQMAQQQGALGDLEKTIGAARSDELGRQQYNLQQGMREALGRSAGGFGVGSLLSTERGGEQARIASEAMARAAQGGGGSSFICSAIRETGAMTREESEKMTEFMFHAVATRADFVLWYLDHADNAVYFAKEAGYDFKGDGHRVFVAGVLRKWKEEGLFLAQQYYADHVLMFVKQYCTNVHFDHSMFEKGMWKSLKALPIVLLTPRVISWSWKYVKAKFRGKKLCTTEGGV